MMCCGLSLSLPSVKCLRKVLVNFIESLHNRTIYFFIYFYTERAKITVQIREYRLVVRNCRLDEGCIRTIRNGGVLVHRDLPVSFILLCNHSVVPDEVRPVPGDVVAFTQDRRIVDRLVTEECAMTNRGLFSLRLSLATPALHLSDKPVILVINLLLINVIN